VSRLDLTFHHADAVGQVLVTTGETERPEAVGALPGARGLTWCRADVAHPAEGYLGFFGWIQVVRSTDNRSGGSAFETDPLEVLGPVGHPFAFYGLRPSLYDAPSRASRQDLDWQAHSFLTRIAAEGGPVVECLAGFSWGFSVRGGIATTAVPESVGAPAWDGHRALLSATCPGWRFRPGVAR